MTITRSVDELREALSPLRDGARVGLVPTMGAFHDGHVALIRAARTGCDVVVVSLFVNPAQFGPDEDLIEYPRDVERDQRMADEHGVDVLFAPATDELYPAGFQTWVDVEGLASRLEGRQRPGHFRGVATVCLKLFNIVRPDVAYFGQKDAQQAALLRTMIRDLNLELELRVEPTVRDTDGLALSSRNAYLSIDERERARALPRALQAGRAAFLEGRDPVEAARAALNGVTPDYVDVIELGSVRLLAAAARIGDTRLIDNVILEGELA